jgi:tetratricopeptide (TPR) repeat protein
MTQPQDHVIRYRYDDFILKLRQTDIEHEYFIEAQAPNGDRRERSVVLPQWPEDRSIIYSSQEQDKANVKQLGNSFFDALFQGGILTLYRQSLEDIVGARDDTPTSHTRGLRVILDLQHAAELTCIPWEFLYDTEKEAGEKFLCLDPQTPVVRRLHSGVRSFKVEPPLSFYLLSAAAPPGEQHLSKVDEEIRDVQKAMRANRNVKVEGYLPAAKASDLLDIMKSGHHIVHFTGHGSEYQLAFDDVRLSDEQIRPILSINPALRLVVINACLAGQRVAEALAHSGIPAVIGAQFEIIDLVSQVFAKEFYEDLAVGYSLEASLSLARVAMGMAFPDFEWAGPVLYLQAASSEEVLGDALIIPTDKEKAPTKPDLRPPDAEKRLFSFMLERGRDLSKQGHYPEALAFLEEADRLWERDFGEDKREIKRDIQRCQTELEEDRRKSQYELSKTTLLEKAKTYADVEPPDWDNAFDLLQTIGELEELEERHRSRKERGRDRPTLRLLDRDANDLYQPVREGRSIAHECEKRQTRLKAVYHQGEEGWRQGEEGWRTQDWDQAIIFFEGAAGEVNALKNYGVSVDERYQEAEARAKESYNQKELRQRYQEGVSLIERERWREAVNVLEQLKEQDPSYPNLGKQLEKARRERNARDAYDRGTYAIQKGNWQLATNEMKTVEPGTHCYHDAHLAMQYAQGRLHMDQGEWPQAVEALAAVVRRRPDFEGNAQQWYEKAQFCRNLEAHYQEGRRRMEEKDWQGAKEELEQIKREQEKRGAIIYPDVDEHLRKIDEEIRLKNHYQQARNFFDTKDWERAISHLQAIFRVLREDEDYEDAREMLNQAQKHQEAEAAYQRGVEATLKQDWPTAVHAFEEALRLQPDHEEARRGLETAQLHLKNLELEDKYQKGIAAYRRGVTVDGVANVAAMEEAIQCLEQVVGEKEEFRDAADKLKDSRRLLEAEHNYQEAIRTEKAEDWAQAVRFWQRVADLARELNRDYRDAASRLKLAIRRKELAELYWQAQTHQNKENWAEAVTVLSDLVERARKYKFVPYKDAEVQLKEARRQARIAECFEEGLFCMKTERWEDAITLFNEITHLDPEHDLAQEKLEEARQQLQLQRDYEAGVIAIKSEDWPTAVEYLRRVVKEDKNYKDAATHLEMALHRQKLADSYHRGLEHTGEEEWDQAFACFDEVKREDPNYLDVQIQWRRAYEYKEINQLYQEARKLEKEGKLEEAIKYYDEVERRRQNVQQS